MNDLRHIQPSLGMVHIAVLALLVLAFQMNVTLAQEVDSTSHSVEIFLHVGYHAMDLSSMKGLVDGLEAVLRQTYNIRAQKLLRFPGNAIVGASMTWRVSEITRIELGANYTRSRGHVAYKDMYGFIDEDLRVSAIFIHAGAQRDLFQIDQATVFLGTRAGGLISRMNVSERINFTEFPENNSAASENGTAYFIMGELSAGIRMDLFGWNVAVEGGYRTNLENFQYDFNDSFDGWTFATRIEIPLGG
jgi:hypothetical protein